MELTFDEFNPTADEGEYLALMNDSLRVIRGAFVHFFLRMGENFFLQKLLKRSALISIKVNGELAGFIAYTLTKNGSTAYIERFNIKTRFREQGFGTRALEFVEAKAKESHCSKLELAVYVSNPALRLYKRFGFEKVGFFRWVCWWIYVMQKNI